MAQPGFKVTLGALPKALVEEPGAPWVKAAREAAVRAAGTRLHPIMVRHEPSGATGLLRQMTGFDYSEVGGQPAGFVGPSGPAAPYARWANDGRAPGRMPPFRVGSSLHLWAKRVLGDGGAAFQIARRIATQGTRSFRSAKYGHFVEKTIQDGRVPAQRAMADAAVDVLKWPEKYRRG